MTRTKRARHRTTGAGPPPCPGTVEVLRANEAYERVLAGDVRYRFVIDTATIWVGRQPPAASRQPPAASRQPPAASRQPPAAI